MRPLRLQIVVQPRLSPSSSTVTPSTAPTPSEPTIKWLEICTGDPTIQELSEILEARFLQRNNAPLNIKILKFLDDVELFPSYKVRQIFEDIKDGDKSLSTVKVYRNPPTAVELADPHRFDSLPPDSLARPQKRSFPPPPPPPLFADAGRDAFNETVHGQPFWLDHRQPNKRRKIQPYNANANTYVNDPDQVIDSLEPADDGQNPPETAHQHPSSGFQVEDSQTTQPKSLQRNPSNPYGTPISSQISHQEQESSYDDEVTSVPDSPSSAVIHNDLGDLQPPILSDGSRSGSPELPSSLGRSPQPRDAAISTQTSTFRSQTHQSHRMSDVVQAQGSQPLQNDHNAVSPKGSDDVSRPRGNHVGAEPSTLPTQHTQQRLENSQTVANAPVPNLPNREVLQNHSTARPQSLKEVSKLPASDSTGEARKRGRLSRPHSLKSHHTSPGTRRIINGVRAKRPSIPAPFDPIETSEGSGRERVLLRSANKPKTSAPQETPKSIAGHKKARSVSPVGRYRLPRVAQSVSSNAAPAENSQHDETLDAQQHSNTAGARVSGHPRASEKVHTGAADPPCSATGNPNNEMPRPIDKRAAAESHVESLPTASKSNLMPSTQDKNQDNGRPSSTQQDSNAAGESFTNNMDDSSPTLIDDLGVDVLEQQLKELQEAKDKAQAEFDRITAQKKKRQELLNSKAAAMASHDSQERNADKEPIPPLLAMSEEGRRIFSGDDVHAKRKYAVEELVPARNKYLRNMSEALSALDRKEKERQAAVKAKEKEAQAEAKRQARLAREQKNREERNAIAKRLDEERKKQEEEEAKKVEQNARIEQERLAAKERTENARRAKEKAAREENLARQKVESERTEQPGPESQCQHKGTRVESEAEGTAVDRKRHESEKSAPSSGQATRHGNRFNLAERSPKARRNAALQVQLANEHLKQSKKDSTVAASSSAMLRSKMAKSTAGASRPLQDADSKQTTSKTHRNNPQSNTNGATGTPVFADQEALKAAGLCVSALAPSSTTKSKASVSTIAATKATAADLAWGGSARSPQDLDARSSRHSLNHDDPSKGRTMTPVIPTSSMKSNPDSAEAKAARRAASVGKTPMRSALRLTPSASRRSVSFVDEWKPGQSLIARLHGVSDPTPTRQSGEGKKGMLQRAVEEAKAREGEPAGQGSTPVSSSQVSAKDGVGKTRSRTKQTTMTQHLDPKLKGKAVQRLSPIRVPEEDQIIISSASEASTYFSDESERERNGRAGPSSRKKAKRRTSSSVLASAGPAHRSESKGSGDIGSGSRTAPSGDADMAPTMQADGAGSSQSQAPSGSRSASQPISVISTDDVSNLPSIAGPKQEVPEAKARGVPANELPVAKRLEVEVKAARMRNEERLQREANEQLQREHKQALQAETIKAHPSNQTGGGYKITQAGIGPEHESYGSRIRINTVFARPSLSQLRKEQAAAQSNMEPSVKKANSQKAIAEAANEADSDSELESESSSSESIEEDDPSKVVIPATSKKNHLQRTFKDLFGRSK